MAKIYTAVIFNPTTGEFKLITTAKGANHHDADLIRALGIEISEENTPARYESTNQSEEQGVGTGEDDGNKGW